MAVLKNKRRPSPFQYEETFWKLYSYTRQKMLGIPKRRRDTVAVPILERMNAAYLAVMGIAYDTVKGSREYMQVKRDRTAAAIRHLQDLQMPLMVYWAISGDREEERMKPQDKRKREYWVRSINDEINLLAGLLRSNPCRTPEDEDPPILIIYYTQEEIRKSLFLTMMQQLLRTTHTRRIRMAEGMRDADGDILISLVNDAWYHAVSGNKIIPRNRKEYEMRRGHFSRVISDLTKMNRPMMAVFGTCVLSEEQMSTWAHLLEETAQICYRLQQSDRKRFGGLH